VNIKIAWGINVLLLGVIAVLCFILLNKVPASQGVSGQTVKTSATVKQKDTIATVGKEEITEEEWVKKLKSYHGKEILEEMINKKVINQLAEKYNIIIPEAELDREMEFFERQLQTSGEADNLDSAALREEIKFSILFEEIITRDVVIDEQSINTFYEDNQKLFNLSKQYHLSHIVVDGLDNANQVKEELIDGGSFSTLAMEWSDDLYTRTSGGDLGWVGDESSYLPSEYLSVIENLEVDQFSSPIKLEDGYAIIYLHDVKPKKQFQYNEVKSQIRRQLAISQIKGSMSPIKFWDQIKVDWPYIQND
jgi:foldase protein PrsA